MSIAGLNGLFSPYLMLCYVMLCYVMSWCAGIRCSPGSDLNRMPLFVPKFKPEGRKNAVHAHRSVLLFLIISYSKHMASLWKKVKCCEERCNP